MVATRAPRTIDLAGLIDGRKLTPFNYVLIALSTLVTLFDGLDMMMMSFTAPYMQDELALSDTQISLAFSAGTAGMVVGGLIFRLYRRPDRPASDHHLLHAFLRAAHVHHRLCAQLRAPVPAALLDGLAIGGALPLAWALNVRVRAQAHARDGHCLHHDGLQLR